MRFDCSPGLRAHGQVPSFKAGLLTQSTVWPWPGLREQPPSLCTEREDDQRLSRLLSYTPSSPFREEEGGESAMLPSECAEHGVSSELLTGDLSGRPCPVR
jgi:hypothetical protein